METQTQSPKLIPGVEVCRMVGFKRTKLNLLVRNKQFPQPVRFSKTFVRWDVDEVSAWIETQKAARA